MFSILKNRHVFFRTLSNDYSSLQFCKKNKYTAVLLMSVMKHAIKIYVICYVTLFLKIQYGLAVMQNITMGLFSINLESFVKDI